ncbi:PspA/IM30 family protein [Aminobacter carboxidus]|uniref:PspA/IM30 family protein n=1 Tax=Aminobacter carboxidus TaxID=376165 RepID=A0ABR9GVH4_9HYPH|nr:PspA/IM30 family protein [Aminobacter carboxidus]MBE1207693.1 PspA/IM30 family protein [Aminobacter carboxidus]
MIRNVFKSLLAVAGAKAETGLENRFAIDLIEQHIRNAQSGLTAAKHTLATIVIRHRSEQAALSRLVQRLSDLEQRTASALHAGASELAHDGATVIAELENERAVRQATLAAIEQRITRMRLSIEKAHAKIVDLNQGLISARALDAEHRAQRGLNRSLGGSTGFKKAEALIARIHDRSDPLKEAFVIDAIDDELSGDAVRARLANAGHGRPVRVDAAQVLQRLAVNTGIPSSN